MYVSDIVAALVENGLCQPTCKIYAECDEHGNSDLADQLKKLHPGEAAGFLQLLKLAADRGLKNLPSKCSHEIDRQEKIYEFRKGNYRIAWFSDQGNIVVCSHLFRKKTQKTPQKEVTQAVSLRDRYRKALNSGELIIVESIDKADKRTPRRQQ